MASVTVNFTPQQLIDELVDQALLFRVGTETIAIIRARTKRGEFLPGSTTAGYSTNPAPMPLGGIRPKSAQAAVVSMLKNGDAGVNAYTSKSGKVWVTLKDGYKQLRDLAEKQSAVVDLTWTGEMLRAIHVNNVDVARKEVTIGFSSSAAGQRAGFHHEGAGRSKIKRTFMGLTSGELADVVKKTGLE